MYIHHFTFHVGLVIIMSYFFFKYIVFKIQNVRQCGISSHTKPYLSTIENVSKKKMYMCLLE